ncbi:MAG TPA: hypothetical protein GXZ40_05100 [Bacteroidales bacterium]|jgi:transcriptional regulator with XRE-family HTH domain|nr:hypothetical protein [Bacteroidales bacterium]
MTGKILRNKLKTLDIPLREIATRLKISDQNLQNKLNAKDVKVSFLIELARCLEKDVCFFIDEDCPDFEEVNEDELGYYVLEATENVLSEKDKDRRIRMLEKLILEKDKVIRALQTSLEASRDLVELQRVMLQSYNKEMELPPQQDKKKSC